MKDESSTKNRTKNRRKSISEGRVTNCIADDWKGATRVGYVYTVRSLLLHYIGVLNFLCPSFSSIVSKCRVRLPSPLPIIITRNLYHYAGWKTTCNLPSYSARLRSGISSSDLSSSPQGLVGAVTTGVTGTVGVGCGELGAVTTGVGGAVGWGVYIGSGVGTEVGVGVGPSGGVYTGVNTTGVSTGVWTTGVPSSCRFFICLFLFLLFFWF